MLQFGFVYRPENFSLNVRFKGAGRSEGLFRSDILGDFGMVLSRRTSFEHLFFEYGAGVSLVFQSKTPDRETNANTNTQGSSPAKFLEFNPPGPETRFAVGLPIEILLGWKLNRRFALALQGYTNFNIRFINYGTYITLQFLLQLQ